MKKQKNDRGSEEFNTDPRNTSPRNASSVFNYSEVMDFSGQITSSIRPVDRYEIVVNQID